MARVRTVLILTLIVLVAILGLRQYGRSHPEDVPWTPLDLRQPIGLATHHKLLRLENDPGGCRDTLLRAGVRFLTLPDRRDGPVCGYSNVLFLERTTIAYSPQPLKISCPMVAALVVWERQVLRPQAQRLLGSEIERIDHIGSYNCRRIGGGRSWSEHATANALDVGGVHLADGRDIRVASDWKAGTPAAAFLHAARDGACRLFGTTLSPDYNAAHASHLHLDMKRWSVCR